MVSGTAIRQAIYQCLNVPSVTTLLANGSASLIHAQADASDDYPFVIFNKQSSRSHHVMGAHAYDDQMWLVKAVDRNTKSGPAESIAAAVDELLDLGSLSIDGGDLLLLSRVSDVDYVETDGDQTYRHHGALYRLSVA